MTYFKNQFTTLLIYILLLFTGSVLTMLKVTGSSYFIILTIAAIIATGLMVYLTQKSSPNNIEEQTSTSDKIKWIIIGTVGALVIQIGISLIEELVLHHSIASANTTQLLTLVTAYPYYFIYVLICAPIMEEIVFRRLFFSNLITLTNVYWAGIISAAFFAFMHQDTRFAVYVGMGLWFAFVYYKSKNIYISAASHLIMNTIVVITSFFI